MRLFTNIFISVLIAGAILRLLEVPMEMGLYKNADNKLNYVEQHAINADILLQGDCHMEQNINPKLLTQYSNLKCYNLALGNSNFGDNYLFLQHYLKHQAKPKMVMLYVGVASFDSTFGSAFNTFKFVRLLHEPDVWDLVQEYDPGFARLASIPFMRYAYYSNFTYYRALKGFWDTNRTGAGTLRQADGFLASGHYWEQSMYQFKYEPINVAWSKWDELNLKRIIKLARDRKLQLALVQLPVYHKTPQVLINYYERIKQIQEIAQQHSVPFYQLSNKELQQDSLNYFSAFNVTARGIPKMNEVFGTFIRDSIEALLQNNSKHTTSIHEYYEEQKLRARSNR